MMTSASPWVSDRQRPQKPIFTAEGAEIAEKNRNFWTYLCVLSALFGEEFLRVESFNTMP